VCADAIADLENTHTEVIESDDIAETLCEYAKDRGVDLIVAGNQGISGIVRVLMGSVAEEIVRHAPCAVLIVRVDEPS
jgi:nucleotide-binding universal stress UspA family protein